MCCFFFCFFFLYLKVYCYVEWFVNRRDHIQQYSRNAIRMMIIISVFTICEIIAVLRLWITQMCIPFYLWIKKNEFSVYLFIWCFVCFSTILFDNFFFFFVKYKTWWFLVLLVYIWYFLIQVQESDMVLSKNWMYLWMCGVRIIRTHCHSQPRCGQVHIQQTSHILNYSNQKQNKTEKQKKKDKKKVTQNFSSQFSRRLSLTVVVGLSFISLWTSHAHTIQHMEHMEPDSRRRLVWWMSVFVCVYVVH